MQNRIIFEDKDIIVYHKPAGVAVQSANIRQRDLVSILSTHLAEANAGKNQQAELHVIHRLDQPVEGIVLFAKNKKAAADLSRQITQNTMKKVYHAVCCKTDSSSAVMAETGALQMLCDYLIRDGRTNTSRIGKKGERDAKPAELTYTVLAEKDDRYVLVKIDLKTGRHHQIRVQMAHAGLPLYGDQKYNSACQDYLTDSGNGKVMTALCATSLTFDHPGTRKNVSYGIKPEGEIFHLFEDMIE